MKKQIAQVVVGLPVDKSFDYKIDSAFLGKIKVGQRVIVPFQSKKMMGFVVGLKETSPFEKLRSIINVLDSEPVISPNLLKLAEEFSKYYCCSFGEAVETFLPRNLKKTKKSVEISIKKDVLPNKRKPRFFLVCGQPTDQSWIKVLNKIKNTINAGQGVIVLVPENLKIKYVADQLKEQTKKEVIVLDKKIRGTEELKNWLRLKNAEASVVVGTRSCVFAPVYNLGLIVILEENNFSYKQDQSPFYHARDVALMRSRIEKCSFVALAQVPSVEIFFLTKSKEIDLVNLYPKTNLPVQVIDISNYKPRKNTLVSIPLYYAIEKTLNERGKILLLMNKRGFSSFGVCAKCQNVLKCPRCDVHLTYLFHSKEVVCRHCNYKSNRPEICPSCNVGYLNFTGQGIEKLESEVARIFPSARVSCFDRDSGQIKKDFDVLVATQAVLNLQKKPSFDLTAVVQLDSELNRLDYRAAHKAFSLLLHLKSLTNKQMVIQTRLADNYCIENLAKDDFLGFYENELELRKEIECPPFVHMAEVLVRSLKKESALIQADALYQNFLSQDIKGVEVSDPQPHMIAQLRDQYRFAILIKSKEVQKIVKVVRQGLKDIKRKADSIVTINVDP
ncbi:MAG: primosomal protein N' [Candidatus Omnitrophica bacterium]|nr:primosomal protein N' [Candidatus Omnitrophota bacterium]